jgi:N-acetylmuramoyl-L-alanine amidase
LTISRKSAVVLLAVLASVAAAVYSSHAQSQPQTPPAPTPSAPPSSINHNLVVIDPAHGGPDSGASLGDQVYEKTVTLAFAAKLRAALASSGVTVITTRDADPSALLPTDARAEIANRTHAVACIVLHATQTGSGVHLYTSTLPPAQPEDPDTAPPFVPVPWEMAQAAFVEQSLRLVATLSSGVSQSRLPVLTGKAAVRPLDNLMCPAVAVELAPLRRSDSDTTSSADSSYQQQAANALAAALVKWRDQAGPSAPRTSSTPQAAAASSAIAAANGSGRRTAADEAGHAPTEKAAP